MIQAVQYQTTDRVQDLRRRVLAAEHAKHRVQMPSEGWSVADSDATLPERAGLALMKLFSEMPVAITRGELIVGTRSMLYPGEDGNPWAVGGSPVPQFHNQRDDDEGRTARRECTHNVPGFAKVLTHGYGGLMAKCEARLAEEPDVEKQNFLKGFILGCQAVGTLINRYAALASEMAETETDPDWANDLRTIAEVCSHIATEAPRNFHEAAQLHWFIFLATWIEQGVLVTGGRFDQHTASFWPNDPAEQLRAKEIIDCYVIKCNDLTDIWTPTSMINNLIILGGYAPDGSDGTNAISWAFLDSVGRLNLPDPQPAVRINEKSDPAFVRFTCQLMRDGLSQVCIFNDDTFVPALVAAGFPAEDARNYALDACQDLNIEGKSNFYVGGAVPMAPLLLKTLEEAPDDADWPAFLQRYKDTIAAATHKRLTDRIEWEANAQTGYPLLLLSLGLDDCIEKGLDITQHGLHYRDKGVFVQEPVCGVNSLAAIKHVVFDEQAATLADVRDACANDYANAEPLRQRLLAAPKWGNDDDRVDLIGKEILEFACEDILQYRLDDDARFLSGIHQPHQVSAGGGLPATPDGRHAGDSISVTLAPANGTDLHGPTAVMRSVTKIDPMLCQWNHSLTMTFDPVSFGGDSGLDKFVALVNTYCAMGGPQLQVNFVSAETLREAQKNPKDFPDLVVRVWGYCARFIDLDPEYQEDIINRTVHAM